MMNERIATTTEEKENHTINIKNCREKQPRNKYFANEMKWLRCIS